MVAAALGGIAFLTFTDQERKFIATNSTRAYFS
jgi:hypothetical protein